jgi:hypothetical protein
VAQRVSINDLLFAEDWLANGYEGDPDEDDNVDRGKRVAAWIHAEIERRQQAAADRAAVARVAEETGRNREELAATLRQVRRQERRG